MANKLLVKDVEKWFLREDGQKMKVLDKVSFYARARAITCVVGPSGCGKSTLLNIVSGLEKMEAGAIEVIDEVKHERRKPTIGYVFQNARLLPWKRVGDNIKLALKGANVPVKDWEERIDKYLDLVGLIDFKHQYPLYLSGGMRQRVALARALAVEADLVLMDEPFASLDELTSVRLREETKIINEQLGCTILFVTHNIFEAAFMSNYVVVLSARPAKIRIRLENPNPHIKTWGTPEMYEFSKKIEKIVMAAEH